MGAAVCALRRWAQGKILRLRKAEHRCAVGCFNVIGNTGEACDLIRCCRATGALRTGDFLKGLHGSSEKKSSIRGSLLELIRDPTEKKGARAWSSGAKFCLTYVNSKQKSDLTLPRTGGRLQCLSLLKSTILSSSSVTHSNHPNETPSSTPPKSFCKVFLV